MTATGVGIAGTVALTAGPAHSAAPRTVETPFAYQGSAYGTRVVVQDPGAGAGAVGSGRTAWSLLGCTSMAPIRHGKNAHVGKVNANELIEVGAVDSSTSSYRRPARRLYGSRSINRVSQIVLGPQDGPRLVIGALTTTADASNVNGRFRARSGIDLLGVRGVGIVPDGSDTPGPLGDLLAAIDEGDDRLAGAIIESAGTTGIDIPEVGTIYLAGRQRSTVGRTSSKASAFGIRVALDNGSRVDIGRAYAGIRQAHPSGNFTGRAWGVDAQLVDGLTTVGRLPLRNMPCRGTSGEWWTEALADLAVPGVLETRSLAAQVLGKPYADGRAVARARSTVQTVELADGALQIRGVVGQVNVFQNRAGRITRRNISGTRVGSIVANGETYAAPAPGESLEIPGLATVRFGLSQAVGKRGMRVHALRVELLESNVVVNVGTAQVRIVR